MDTCTFNRPFDDQNQLVVKFEAEAKIHIQEKIQNGELELVWSYILEYENANNPFIYRKIAISKWRKIAKILITETPEILKRAKIYIKMGLKSKDALHVSCAVEAKAKYFITTDQDILRKLKNHKTIIALSLLILLVS
ncbi:MAG: PIN domain-containing protein [candidate division KSB1 bacterium]|nr:PIN domain-containing protein [candidate division KSB1 bacterium]MDQ7064604.1 PIN domain-containing protein [candidate division KSB1 bacterium]